MAETEIQLSEHNEINVPIHTQETTDDVDEKTNQRLPSSPVRAKSTLFTAHFDESDIASKLFLLEGLRSKMIDENKELIKDMVFTVNYRCCIVIFISLGIVYFDYRVITKWYWTFTFLLIAIIIMCAAIFCQVRNKKLVENPDSIPWYYTISKDGVRPKLEWKIFHVEDATYSATVALAEVKKKNEKPKNHKYKHFTYDNAMNWFLDIRNTMGVIGHRVGWILPFVIILLLFGQTLIHYFYAELPIHSFCKSETTTVNNNNIGECLIKDEWGQTLGIVTLVCGAIGLLTVRDLTPFAIEKIKEAQKHLQSEYHFGKDVTDPYYKALKTNRDRRAKLEEAKFIIPFGLFVVLLSLHAVWFQLFTDYEKPFRLVELSTFLICFYIYNVVVFGLAFCLWYIMIYWMYLPFADYYYIVSALSIPIHCKDEALSKRAIEKWWVLRRFYENYVMPVYYGWGEINFFSLLAGSITSWAILLWWSAKKDFVFGYNEVVLVAVGVTWPAIIMGCSYKISGSNKCSLKHSKMLSALKIKLLCHDVGNRFIHNNDNGAHAVVQLVDELIRRMDSYDEPLKIMGVEMTHEKMIAFVVYVVGMAIAVWFEF